MVTPHPNLPAPGDRIKKRGDKSNRLGYLRVMDDDTLFTTVKWDDGNGPYVCHLHELEKVVSKRPKDMTDDELRALPVGPISYEDRPATPEESARGMKNIRIPVMVAVQASYHGEGDAVVWTDPETGEAWTTGQYRDGRWFRRPVIG